MAEISEKKRIKIADLATCSGIINPFYLRWVGPYSWDELFDTHQIYGGNTTSQGVATVNYDTIAQGTQRISKTMNRYAVRTVELFRQNLSTQRIQGLETLYHTIRAQRWLGGENWEDIIIPDGQYTLYDNSGENHEFKVKVQLQPTFTKVS